ncbi:MAG: MMPL family transporter [Nocardioidaceae bacterium]|nr:MMPL family transporter [Nocardioidaceae bacterium]
MQRWGQLITRRRWTILVIAALTSVLAGVCGAGVFGALSDGGFENPDSESAKASEAIVETFGRVDADVLVLYAADGGERIDSPAGERSVTTVVDVLPADLVDSVVTPWNVPAQQAPGLVSNDGGTALVAITLAGDADEDRADAYEQIRPDLDAEGLRTQVGGPSAVFSDVGEQVGADIGRAESLAIPLVLLLSLYVFGSVVSALLPALLGGMAIIGSFAVLRLLTTVTDVSVFAINVIILLGLGLAVDYALFMVSRFREELGRGHDTPGALVATMATAGRTVAFSGLIVTVSLASLLLFPQTFLRSMGFGGMAAVLVAMVLGLTVLPALLAVLGPRVELGALPFLRRGRGRHAAAGGPGAWARIAHAVMRRPVAFLTATVVGLLALGLPFLQVQWTSVDHRVLPEGTQSRTVAERLETEFPAEAGSIASVVVSGADRAEVADYEQRLKSVAGVTDTQTVDSSGDQTLVEVSYPDQAQTEPARELVQGLRNVPPPDGATVLIGGETAALGDLLADLGDTLPWMGLIVVTAMLVLLFLAFGSVVLPVKAVIVNVVSVAASFGVVTWIFQDGNLADTLGFTPLGALDATQPILMLAILFGLSMDYEVFLLSRIRERWDQTHDNTEAVATGLQRTGGIITSAALLLAVVIGAFATSGIVFIKMIGVGMLVAIVLDATVVRALLVPAAMRLMGTANWWAPAPMARWWQRHGLREGGGSGGPGPDSGDANGGDHDVQPQAAAPVDDRILVR